MLLACFQLFSILSKLLETLAPFLVRTTRDSNLIFNTLGRESRSSKSLGLEKEESWDFKLIRFPWRPFNISSFFTSLSCLKEVRYTWFFENGERESNQEREDVLSHKLLIQANPTLLDLWSSFYPQQFAELVHILSGSCPCLSESGLIVRGNFFWIWIGVFETLITRHWCIALEKRDTFEFDLLECWPFQLRYHRCSFHPTLESHGDNFCKFSG